MKKKQIQQRIGDKRDDFDRWRARKRQQYETKKRRLLYVLKRLNYIKGVVLAGVLTMAVAWLWGVIHTLSMAWHYAAADAQFKLSGALVALFVQGLLVVFMVGVMSE